MLSTALDIFVTISNHFDPTKTLRINRQTTLMNHIVILPWPATPPKIWYYKWLYTVYTVIDLLITLTSPPNHFDHLKS